MSREVCPLCLFHIITVMCNLLVFHSGNKIFTRIELNSVLKWLDESFIYIHLFFYNPVCIHVVL